MKEQDFINATDLRSVQSAIGCAPYTGPLSPGLRVRIGRNDCGECDELLEAIQAQSARIEELESENARLEIMAGEGKDALDKARGRIEELTKALKELTYRTKLLTDDMDAKGKPEWRASATFGFFSAMNEAILALPTSGKTCGSH